MQKAADSGRPSNPLCAENEYCKQVGSRSAAKKLRFYCLPLSLSFKIKNKQTFKVFNSR